MLCDNMLLSLEGINNNGQWKYVSNKHDDEAS